MKSNRVRVLLAMAAAGVALTACSAPVGVGTAATVGNDRISSKQLDSEVSEFQTGLKAAKVAEDQLQVPSLPRAILKQLITFRLFDQFAQRNGIAVTQADVEKFIGDQGGMGRIGPAALMEGVPPSQATRWVRTILIYQKSLQRFGANLADQASTQVAQDKMFAQLGTIPVKISHRYGTWDLSKGGLVEEARFGAPSTGQSGTEGQPDPATGSQGPANGQ